MGSLDRAGSRRSTTIELKIRKIEQLAITDAQRRREGFATA
jgi:hypothetical protein